MLLNLTSNWHFENDGVDSVSGHDVTFHNGGNFNTAPPTMIGTYSRQNDGVDSYAKTPWHADFNTDSTTMVVWFYPTDIPGAVFTEFPFLMSNDSTSTSTRGRNIFIYSNNGTWVVRFVVYWSDGSFQQHAVFGLSTNELHCIKGSFDNTTKVLSTYIDGYLRAQTTHAGKTLKQNTNDWRFGTRQITAPETFAGYMDEYAQFSEAISDGGVAVDELAGGVVAQIWNGGAGIAIDTIGEVAGRIRGLGKGLTRGLGRGL